MQMRCILLHSLPFVDPERLPECLVLATFTLTTSARGTMPPSPRYVGIGELFHGGR
jgi:hypothetical protein